MSARRKDERLAVLVGKTVAAVRFKGMVIESITFTDDTTVTFEPEHDRDANVWARVRGTDEPTTKGLS